MDLITERTERGFDVITFKDRYNTECNIQKSSLAYEDCIWFGVACAQPKIMAKDTQQGGVGWVDYKIPDNVCITTRMHLTRKDVLKLLPILIRFVLTGNIMKRINKYENNMEI